MIEDKRALREAIEREWKLRGKYIAPSGLSRSESRGWVIRLDLASALRKEIEFGDVTLGKHIIKGLQSARAGLGEAIKVETFGPFPGHPEEAPIDPL